MSGIKQKERTMNIKNNEETLFKGVDLKKDYGTQKKINLVKELIAKDGKGIELFFEATSGKTILSAIKLKKIK